MMRTLMEDGQGKEEVPMVFRSFFQLRAAGFYAP
jgi:hypothetical protein